MLPFFSALLLVVVAGALVLSAIGQVRRWTPGVLVAAVGLQLLLDGYYSALLPVYILAVVVIALEVYRLRRQDRARRTGPLRVFEVIWSILWRSMGVFLVLTSMVLAFSLGNSNVTLMFAMGSATSAADYSDLSEADAFGEMQAHLMSNYAFGDWKAIDWAGMQQEFAPQISSMSDDDSYYLALRGFVHSIPDGHVRLRGGDDVQREQAIGGGFGLALVRLDRGDVIATIVTPGGPAEKAGMRWGAEIVAWGGIPVGDALEATSTVWAGHGLATNEGQSIWKQHLLTRAPVGTDVSISYLNPGETVEQKATLTAIDDKMETLSQSVPMGSRSEWDEGELVEPSRPVESEILPNGYGYLRINYEPLPFLTFFASPSWDHIDPVGAVRRAVRDFIDAGVPGVVIDVRGNLGGTDHTPPMMMAHFIDEPTFYEQIAFIDEEQGTLDIVGDLRLEPSQPFYTGPVVVLVDNETVSSGEGFPLLIQTAGRGQVVGFHGTNGSFGMSGSTVGMPGGYAVRFPNGASLDEGGVIQGDSDATLTGGYIPDVRVPITEETMKAVFLAGRDVVLETAVDLLEGAAGT